MLDIILVLFSATYTPEQMLSERNEDEEVSVSNRKTVQGRKVASLSNKLQHFGIFAERFVFALLKSLLVPWYQT